jgi:hypothetical protein
MNGLLWMSQMLLAGILLIAAAGKLFAYEKFMHFAGFDAWSPARKMTHNHAGALALAEIVGAVALILPVQTATPYLLEVAAAAWLALIMAGEGVYHALRHESAAPSVTLFLLALFILFGRWPR